METKTSGRDNIVVIAISHSGQYLLSIFSSNVGVNSKFTKPNLVGFAFTSFKAFAVSMRLEFVFV
jgi:hypothetical protein